MGDSLEVQESTNMSQNTSIPENPRKDNLSTTEVFEENVGKESYPWGNKGDFKLELSSEDVENDQNVSNAMSQKENLDTEENAEEAPKLIENHENIESDNEKEDLVNAPSSRRKSKKLNFLHSDSENEDEFTNKTETTEQNSDQEDVEPVTGHQRKLKRIAIIDSDSEDEPKLNSEQDSIEGEVVEYKSVDQNNSGESNAEKQKKSLYALCDSESSDDNIEEDEDKNEGGISETELEALQSNEIIPKSRKGKQKQKTENKEEKMTAKKALEQRKEILAESQRRVRESRVSLPYHKPKCRSLKEFLQNRPKLAAPLSAVSTGRSPSLSIKMSMKQLEVITQKMKEREREVEKFYKSESESEPEEESKNDNIEKADAKEIMSASNAEVNQSDDTTQNESTNDNNSVENIDLEHNKNTHDYTAAIGLIGNEEVKENIEDDNSEEICDKLDEIFEKTEETPEQKNNTESISTDEKNLEEFQENKDSFLSESNENTSVGVKDVGDLTNPELESSDQTSETKEQGEIETKSENNSNEKEKIILISDIVVKPTESNESKNVYDLDEELLELASEVEKDEKDQHNSYEFNLDDIEDESEIFQNGDNSRKEKLTSEEIKNRRLEILEKIGLVKPRLSVGPNEVIDLENGIAMPDEISRLRERFIRHNLKSEKHSHKKEISILSVSDGQIHKETLAFKMDENEEEDTKPLEKPGVRMQKLREELQHRMSLRRSDLWKERLNKKGKTENLDGENDNEEKSECGMKDILDNEEEEEFTDPEEEDEELEENDCDMSEKKKKKSNFIDEEAEESELEENEVDENEDEEAAILDENEEENVLEDNDENEDNDEEDDNDMIDEEADVEDNEETANIEEDVPKKKVLKRIIKAFEEDSDDENEEIRTTHIIGTTSKTKRMDNDCASENLLSSLEPHNFKIREPMLSPEKSQDHFATPVTYMTGIKNLNTSGLRFAPPDSSLGEDNPSQKSQVNDSNKECNTGTEKSQLDSQNEHVDDSLSTQDVLGICSGEFPSSSKTLSSPEISTQQLREVFTGSMKSTSDFNTQDIDDICSGGFTGVTQATQIQEKETALDDKDEHLISQLIDEDELENFKKKFESPGVNSNLNITKSNTPDEVEEVAGTGGVIDSDDEETGLKLKDRKRKRLAFSDDEESSSSETAQEEETIDLHDEDYAAGNVEYDSEENEIEDTGDNELCEENKPKKFKASDFFDEEAELSESEWGSADEDERNLDDLEFEKGDEENFDQDKMRTDIEKLQMKQMLDEDNRELKMLQELLLEDGELHGSGRQRQFRWKNIDAAANEAEGKKDDDDDVYLEEDEETEEKWRKERHEREMLKLKNQSQAEEDSLIIESQSLSFTHKSLKIKSQTTFSPQVTSNEVVSSPKIKQPFALLNKRGSFLSRGEKILQKIAETSKVSFTNKNVNRIVFQTIDEETKKRKASAANLGSSTPVALKKLRLSGLSPGLHKNRPKLGKSIFEKILD